MTINTVTDNESSKSVHSDLEEKYDDASSDIPPEGKFYEYKTEIDDTITSRCDEISTDSETTTIKSVKVEEEKCRLEKPNPDHKKCDLCKYFYVIGDESYAVHAQEPWPKDVKLFQPYEVEQILLPDNANCLAVQAFLKMCNLDFQIESRSNAEYMSPTGKVPFIKCGAFLVAELEGIVAFVAQKGISLTEHLDPEQKADLRAYQALINNVLGAAENYVCWCDRETYREVTKPRNGSVYPWPLNLMQTWSKKSKQIKALKTLGWYEKTLEEVFQEVETCCQALTDRLENNTYFFGNKFTELDALLYGHIYSLLTTCLPVHRNNFVNTLNKFDKLIRHCKRIDTTVMKRKSELIPDIWMDNSKSDLNIFISDIEGDRNKFQDNVDGNIIGDAERESDWLVIDKKVDIDDTDNAGDGGGNIDIHY